MEGMISSAYRPPQFILSDPAHNVDGSPTLCVVTSYQIPAGIIVTGMAFDLEGSAMNNLCLTALKTGVLMMLLTITAAAGPTLLTGTVIDSDSHPIPGATVLVLSADSALTGTATDTDGSFRFALTVLPTDPLELQVSSVGFATVTVVFKTDGIEPLRVVLEEEAAPVGDITVRPDRPLESTREIIDNVEIEREAQTSLVPTNPIAAINQPQVSRPGSTHSSQVRVLGTNPVYFLNGLPIGTDPAHYGLFAFIPTSVIDRIGFYPLGSPVRHRLSAVVEMDTYEPFGGESSANLVLSTIEATGAFKWSNDRYYVLGSLRKSVLDRIVNHLDVSTDRTTLPPTNFQDVFGSVGLKLSDRVRLMIDQYHVRDFLSYNTTSVTGANAGVDTYVSSRESQIAVRLEALGESWLALASGGIRSGAHHYKAAPIQDDGVHAYLNEEYLVGYGRTELTLVGGPARATVGAEIEADYSREFNLDQQNWNFMPPFSSSDNPYVYQQALNEIYGDYADTMRSVNRAVYGSIDCDGDRFVGSAGLRADDYSLLQSATVWSPRVSFGVKLGERSLVEIRTGLYSQSPITDILEPYQILFRANVGYLRPIVTRLSSMDWRNDRWRLSLFHKTVKQLPVIAPDFENPYGKDGRLAQEFLTARSEGSAEFTGFSVSFHKSGLLNGRADLDLSYAFTRSFKTDHEVVLPYDLDSPHRLDVRVAWDLSPAFRLGTSLQWRSGYPYSPVLYDRSVDSSDAFTESYYQAALEQENSQRLAAHASLNVSASYSWEKTELFATISNLTNRANPIISSSSGLIYDAGILPMIGLRISF